LVVGMVSALRPEKGHDIAIGVLRRLRPRFPTLRLLIVGQGDLEEDIRRSAADLGDAVVMAGRRTDVMRVLDAVDVCLQPSRADAFPTSLLEAMAASVPVLATAVGGIPEIVVDATTGVLVAAPPSADEVAAALAVLLDDPATRHDLALAGRVRYEQNFTAGPWVSRTRELYDAVLAESSRPRGRLARARHRADVANQSAGS
jgi:glycosyltransferase involved in cell wall biosynthesis